MIRKCIVVCVMPYVCMTCMSVIRYGARAVWNGAVVCVCVLGALSEHCIHTVYDLESF